MINPQLLGYIRQQLLLKVGREVITANLKSQGWTDADLSEAFVAIGSATVSTPLTSVPVFSLASPMTANVNPNANPLQPVANFSDKPHTKSKILFSVVFILILLCAAGAGAYAYYTGYFVKLPSLLSESFENAKTVTSDKYDITFNVDFSGIKIKDQNNPLNSLSSIGINSKQLSLRLNGSLDISDSKNPKFSSLVFFNVGGVISVEAEIRLIHSIFYAQLTGSPALGTFPLPVPTISPYVGKWFSFPVTMLSSFDSDISDRFTDEQKDHISKLFRDANFITPIAKLSPETVGGKSSHHFSFNIVKNEFISFLQSIHDYLNSISINGPMLPPFDPTVLVKEFDKIKDFKGEIWIGRNDKFVHKIAVSFGVQPDLTKNEQVKLNMIAIFSDYNQPVLITAPTESTPFETLISGIMSDSLGAPEKEKVSGE